MESSKISQVNIQTSTNKEFSVIMAVNLSIGSYAYQKAVKEGT